MKACGSCRQQNPDDARFCLHCGTQFPDDADASAPPDSAETVSDEARAWRVLIGEGRCLQLTLPGGWSWKPAWDYYQRAFRRFRTADGHRFALTWNWAPFLIEPFLWFLYRKMYLFALVYFAGPIVSVFVTGDLSVPLVWSIIAGATANYVYYWHLKDIFMKVKAQVGVVSHVHMPLLADAGGVQPYVALLAVASLLLKFIFLVLAMMGEPFPDQALPPPGDGAGERRVL